MHLLPRNSNNFTSLGRLDSPNTPANSLGATSFAGLFPVPLPLLRENWVPVTLSNLPQLCGLAVLTSVKAKSRNVFRSFRVYFGDTYKHRFDIFRNLECKYIHASLTRGFFMFFTLCSLLSFLQIIAFDDLKTDYKNPVDLCNSLNPVRVQNRVFNCLDHRVD